MVQKELCGEAMRLCQMLLKNEHTRSSEVYALFALMCFHSARLDTKTNADNELLDLMTQDRAQWHFPLIELGNTMMNKAVEKGEFSCYHYEAAIAAEHVRAGKFEHTNWDKILHYYQRLNALQPMPAHVLTMAVVCMQNKDHGSAKVYLDQIEPQALGQRMYLYYGAKADLHYATDHFPGAIENLDKALETVTNMLEKDYLQKKKLAWLSNNGDASQNKNI